MSGMTLSAHGLAVGAVVFTFVAVCVAMTVGLLAHLADMDDQS